MINQEPRSRAAYMRGKRGASIPIYFKDESEKATFQALAEKGGYRTFSAWAVQTLYNSTTGQTYPAGFVQALQDEVKKLRGWVESKDQQIAELQRDIRLAEAAREDLRVIITAVAHKAPEIQQGLRQAEREREARRGGLP